MAVNNYKYRQYIYIAQAFSAGKVDKGNEMLKKLNLVLAAAKDSSNISLASERQNSMGKKDKYHVR